MLSKINEILKIKNTFDAPDRLMEILQNRKEREEVFEEMLELFNHQLDVDWFHQYFQEAFANKKELGQVFTPPHIANLLTMLFLEETKEGLIKDPCSGTGVLTIGKWNQVRKQANYKPSNYFLFVKN